MLAETSRRARRASRAARRRRILLAAGIGGGLALAAAATTGVAATPVTLRDAAASAVTVVAAASVPVAAPAAWGIDAVGDGMSDTQRVIDAATEALDAAAAVEAEVAASGLELALPQTSAGDIAGASDSAAASAALVDTAPLEEAVDELTATAFVPPLLFPERTDGAVEHTEAVEARVDAVSEALQQAVEKKAADEAAAAAAEAQRRADEAAAAAAAAEAQRQAEALAAANTVAGAQATAQAMAAESYGWGGGQFSCLVSLWDRESEWDYRAYNPSSGATGIPQALPGSKMAAAGADWQTSAATQIAWGLDYIDRAYGSPCAAWSHSNAVNWY